MIQSSDFNAVYPVHVPAGTASPYEVPVFWILPSPGSLPAGLSLGTTTGLISGTPTAPGTFPFTVVFGPDKGLINSASLSLTVNP